jgi:hypothetical protein
MRAAYLDREEAPCQALSLPLGSLHSLEGLHRGFLELCCVSGSESELGRYTHLRRGYTP